MKKATIIFCACLFSISLFTQVQAGKFYKIQAKNNGMYFGIDEKTQTEDPVLQQSSIGQGGEWQFIAKPGGYYQIKNKVSNKFIANFGNTAEKAPLKQTANPGDGALWKLIPAGGGYYKLQNKLSRKYIANGGATTSHSALRQFTSVGTGGQWKFIPTGSSSSNSGNNNQLTQLLKKFEKPVYIVHSNGKKLKANPNSNIVSTQTGNDGNLKWIINPKGSHFKIQNKKNIKGLGNGGKSNENAKVTAGKINQLPNQLWSIIPTNDASKFKIKNKQNGLFVALVNNQVIQKKQVGNEGLWSFKKATTNSNVVKANYTGASTGANNNNQPTDGTATSIALTYDGDCNYHIEVSRKRYTEGGQEQVNLGIINCQRSKASYNVQVGDFLTFEVQGAEDQFVVPGYFVEYLNENHIVKIGNNLSFNSSRWDQPLMEANLYGFDLKYIDPMRINARYTGHITNQIANNPSSNPEVAYGGGGGRKDQIFEALRESDTDFEEVPGTNYAIKSGFEYQQNYQRMDKAESSSYYGENSFSQAYSGSLGVSGGVPGAAVASGSVSFNYSTGTNSASSDVYSIAHQTAAIHNVRIKDLSKVKLADEFIQYVKTHNAKQVIEKYGTHYPKFVVYGAKSVAILQTTADEFSELTSWGIDVSANVASHSENTSDITSKNDGSNGKPKAPGTTLWGVSGSFGYEQSDEFKQATSDSRAITHVVGNIDDPNSDNAAPIEVNFAPLHELLIPALFPGYNQNTLRSKKNSLKNEINNHIGTIGNGINQKPRTFELVLEKIKVIKHHDGSKDRKGIYGSIIVGLGGSNGHINTEMPLGYVWNKEESDFVKVETNSEISLEKDDGTLPTITFIVTPDQFDKFSIGGFRAYAKMWESDTSSKDELIGEQSVFHSFESHSNKFAPQRHRLKLYEDGNNKNKLEVIYTIQEINGMFN